MIDVFLWYIIVTAFGLVAWPVAFRFLPGLPDRGFTFSRALGLLLCGYVFWLLTSLGLLRNSVGGILFSFLVVGSFALWAYHTRPDKDTSLSSWLDEHRRLVVVTEVLFLVAFVAWAFVRAYNPELDSTEKPMELTFLNGIRASSVFPPMDPWLSGYSISYYYFGYVVMTMLAELSNTATAVAFNLGIALLFSLTLVGSYGLVYNLVASTRDGSVRKGTTVTALIGPLFTGVFGNLEGLLELIRSLNVPALGAKFWSWMDIESISSPAGQVLWPPDRWRFWWWWQASRVVRDRDLTGVAIGLQPIDEFPMFSFLLGDMHPHVLAIPFVLLALGLAFNILMQKETLSRLQFAIYTICFGALAFLNTWDLPIYLFILIGALVLRQVRSRPGLHWREFLEPVCAGLAVLALGVAAYLPWYITFTSQAGGVLPNAIFPTRFQQFFVMFGPFLVILGWFLIDHTAREFRRMGWRWGLSLGGSILVLLAGMMASLSFVAVGISADVKNFLLKSTYAPLPGSAGEADPLADAFRQVFEYRLAHPATALVLSIIIIICIAALFGSRPAAKDGESAPPDRTSPALNFVFLLVLSGAGLTLMPEFVYLRDNFGQRLNTVFKFYYAAWLLFSIASAYAVHVVVSRCRGVGRAAATMSVALLMAAALVYPAFAIPAKMAPLIRGANDTPPTLNGINYIQKLYPRDYNGILWLQQHAAPGSVLLEAVGGSYTYHGRVSSATGLPAVIGWPGHESQWRGSLFSQMAGGREADVREIYNTTNVGRARALLTQYNVTYVFVGSLENDPTYASPVGLSKFGRMMKTVFQDGDVTIYQFNQSQNGAQP